MTTRFRSKTWAAVGVVVVAGAGVTACGQYSLGALKAKKAWLDGNTQYGAEQWKGASEHYEEALASDPDRMVKAHFYLANSYDNMFKAARKGEAENDAYIKKAVEHYQLAAKSDPLQSNRKLAMQFLVNAYGPEKLDDPSQAEPLIKQMIELEPSDPTNYFGLSKLYEDAGRYDEAEQALNKAIEIKPDDPMVYTTLAGYFNKQGNFDKTIENLDKAANLDAKNPQGYHLIATFFEEKVRKDVALPLPQQREYANKGIEAEDRALSLNPNYVDAMVVKNILLRRVANTEIKDPARQKELIRQADELRNKAIALQKGAKGAK